MSVGKFILTVLGEQPPSEQEPALTVVRKKTTYWKDSSGGMHCKVSLTPMRRKCSGFQILEEDSGNMGFDEEFWCRIENVGAVPDGLYSVGTCNEKRDYESGYIDEYDYELLPYQPEETKP